MEAPICDLKFKGFYNQSLSLKTFAYICIIITLYYYMKRPILLLLFISLYSLSSPAQNAEVLWDTDLQNKDAYSSQMLGRDNATDAFYLLRSQADGYYLQKFDADNRKIFDTPINMSSLKEAGGTMISVHKIIMLKDRFAALMSSYNKKTSVAKAYVQDISFDGELLSTIKPIGDVHSNDIVSFYLESSPDSNTIVACVAVAKQKKADKNNFAIRIYNKRLNEIYSRDVSVSQEENMNYKYITTRTVLIDNAGEVYVLGSKVKSAYKKELCLWYLDATSDQLRPVNLGLKNETIKTSSIITNSFGETVFSGFYNEPNEVFNHHTGYFYGIVNGKNGTVDNIKMTAIPQDAQSPPFSYDALMPECTALLKKDGGQVWVLEYQWYKNDDAHYGDMFVLNIDRDGALVYCVALPKSQVKLYGGLRSSDYTIYYSYLPMFDNSTNTLSLIFNDSQKNSANTSSRPSQLLTINNRVLVVIAIDDKGNVSKRPVRLPANDDTIFCPGQAMQITDNESVALGIRGNNFWLGRLILE